jgi:hypothetical protein
MSLNKGKKLITAIGLWLVSDDKEKSKRIWSNFYMHIIQFASILHKLNRVNRLLYLT